MAPFLGVTYQYLKGEMTMLLTHVSI